MNMKKFYLVDYIVSLSALVLSLSIGLYYAKKGQKSTTDYFLGNKMNVVAVGASMAVTYLSAISILGVSAEIYYFGITYSFIILGKILGAFAAIWIYIPWIYPMKLSTVNEYLQMRFGSKVLVIYGSIVQNLYLLVLAGLVLNGPAILLGAVSFIPPWACLLISGVVSTVYTTLGGFRGVIATDVFQALIMMVGLVVVLTVGTLHVGGAARMWHLYRESGRFQIRSIINPLAHDDVFPLVIGTVFSVANYSVIMPSGFQRVSSMSSVQKAQRMVLIAIVPTVFILGMTILTGIVACGYYIDKECDPLAAGYIRTPNAIMAYLVMDIMRYPGLPGLFIAECLCGALSTSSSLINSAALLIWNDFTKTKASNYTEGTKTLISKVSVACFGTVSVIIGFLVMNLPGTLIQICFSLAATTATPLTLLFIIGGLFPRANWKNVLVTALTVQALLFSLIIGKGILFQRDEILPLPTQNCSTETTFNTTIISLIKNHNITESNKVSRDLGQYMKSNTSTEYTMGNSNKGKVTGFLRIFKVYGLWYYIIGYSLGAIMTFLLSFIPGFQSTEDVDPSLLFPFMRPKQRSFTEYKQMDFKQNVKSGPEDNDFAKKRNNWEPHTSRTREEEHFFGENDYNTKET